MLFKNINDVKKFVTLAANFNLTDIEPIIENDSEPVVLKDILGVELLADLDLKVNTAEAQLTLKENEVVKKCRYIIANHAMYQYTAFGRVTITNGGIVVNLTDKIRSASENQIFMLKQQLESNFCSGINILLQYLEDNKADFPLWTESEAFTLQRQNFINSATEFNRYIYINSNRLLFQRLRSAMSDIELRYLLPVLGQTFFDELKLAVKEDDLTSDQSLLLPYISRIVAKATMAEAVDNIDLKVTQNGIQLTYITQESDKKQIATPADSERLTKFKKQCEDQRDEQLSLLKSYLDAHHDVYSNYPYVAPVIAEVNVEGNGIFGV